MDSTDVRVLMEAYSAVYDEDLRNELEEISELDEDLSFIDDLSDDELDLVMESIILDEGIDVEEILTEATVTSSDERSTRGSARVTKSAGDVKRAEMMAQKRREVRVKKLARSAQRVGEKGVQKVYGAGERFRGSAEKAGAAVKGKLSAAKKGIMGFLGKTGRAAKAAYKAGKAEFTGQAAREAEARTTKRREKRVARKQPPVDTSEFERRRPTGPKPGLPPRMRDVSIVPVSRTQRMAARQASETQSGPRSVRTGYPSGGKPPSVRVIPQPAISGSKAVAALPAGKEETSSRRQAALQKMQKAITGTSSRGVRFAGPSGQVAPKKAHTGIRDAAAKFAKKAGLTAEDLEILLPYILEDIISEGYAETYDEAYEILESLSDYDFDELVESYIEENSESYDFYDTVLEHLLDEGFADNVEDAEMIMANMSEAWIDEILEGV